MSPFKSSPTHVIFIENSNNPYDYLLASSDPTRSSIILAHDPQGFPAAPLGKVIRVFLDLLSGGPVRCVRGIERRAPNLAAFTLRSFNFLSRIYVRLLNPGRYF